MRRGVAEKQVTSQNPRMSGLRPSTCLPLREERKEFKKKWVEELGVKAHACNPSIWGTKAGESGVRGHLQLHEEGRLV